MPEAAALIRSDQTNNLGTALSAAGGWVVTRLANDTPPRSLRRLYVRLGAVLALAHMMGFAIAAETERDWDLEMGIGVASAPAYSGAKRSNLQLRPWLDATLRTESSGTFAIDSGSLTISPELRWDVVGSRHEGLGVFVGYRSGRREYSHGLANLSNRTAPSRGLPDVPDAVDAGVEGHFSAFGLPLFAQVRSALNGSQGTLLNLGVYAALPIGTAELTLLPTLTWADRRQMQAFYGVTPTTSLARGLARYNAGSGLENTALELAGDWPLTDGWHLVASVAYQRLLGNAMRSPIVESRTQASGLIGLALRL